MTLSGATTPGHSEPGSNGNEEVPRIPQSPSITGMSYTGHLLEGSYPSAEVQRGNTQS